MRSAELGRRPSWDCRESAFPGAKMLRRSACNFQAAAGPHRIAALALHRVRKEFSRKIKNISFRARIRAKTCILVQCDTPLPAPGCALGRVAATMSCQIISTCAVESSVNALYDTARRAACWIARPRRRMPVGAKKPSVCGLAHRSGTRGETIVAGASDKFLRGVHPNRSIERGNT